MSTELWKTTDRSVELVSAARRYFDCGWSVIPMRVRSSHPELSWVAHQSERWCRDAVEDWFAAHVDANLGLLTGEASGIVVIEVHSLGGRVALFRLLDGSPDTLKVVGGRGVQYFFQYPGVIVNTRRLILDGVDAYGDAGWVLAPPSVDGRGRAYRWSDEATALAPLPRELLRYVVGEWPDVRLSSVE